MVPQNLSQKNAQNVKKNLCTYSTYKIQKKKQFRCKNYPKSD